MLQKLKKIILWDVMVQYNHEVLHKRPNIVNKERECTIIDIACSRNNRVVQEKKKKKDFKMVQNCDH